MVREAGGIQALASRMQSIEALFEEAGGIQELAELVAEAKTLRSSLNEVGGLQGLSHLTTENHLLRSDQQELVALQASVNGPDGLRAKALKFNTLQQAFATVQGNAVVGQAQAVPKSVCKDDPKAASKYAPKAASKNQPQAQPVQAIQAQHAAVMANRITLTPKGVAAMNPARAAMLSGSPLGHDPNRDLYEAPAPKQKPTTKTGSNDVPLGKRRAGSMSMDQDDLQLGIAKRPRVDIGRASELVQTTLQGRPKTDPNYGRLEPVHEQYNGFLQDKHMAYSGDASAAAPGISSQWDGRLRERSAWVERVPSGSSAYGQSTLIAKRERY